MIRSTAYPTSLREEELKNKVAADWFGAFDCTRIIGNIDFCVDIPATELALGFEAEPVLWAEAKDCFKSHFMSDFLRGRIASGPNPVNPVNPVENLFMRSAPLRLCVNENMSPAAMSVLDAGREIWRYYHAQPDANPDASYYDIRLRAAMKRLAKEIEPKVYEYGFLRK